MTSSIVVAYKSTGLLHLRSYPKSRASLLLNHGSKLDILKWKEVEINFGGKKTTMGFDSKSTRNSFAVCASSVPGAPLPSGPPPASGSAKSWLLGLVLSLILPFFSNKMGPLWVIKNKIDNAVHCVEEIADAVEKVAEQVDKIAEDIGDDLPEGRMKHLVDLVEDMAEKTAKSADSLGDIIDKVQEAEEEVECIVESTKTEGKKSPKEEKKDP